MADDQVVGKSSSPNIPAVFGIHNGVGGQSGTGAASELRALNVPAFMFQEGKDDDIRLFDRLKAPGTVNPVAFEGRNPANEAPCSPLKC
jgi:hypothetical protein